MKRLHLFFLLSLGFMQPIFCDLSYAQKSALGELLTVQSTSISQLNFIYNTNTFLAETNIVDSGLINYANGNAILQTAGSGSASLLSNIHAYAQPGQGFSCVFAAIYANGDSGTKQMAGIGNDVDGFFFGLTDGIFGITYTSNSVPTTLPQSSWNVDPMDGTGPSGIVLHYTDGNIFKIQYQQLEFGNINFLIESSVTGQPILVHQIEYANANTIPSISNPGLQLMAQVTSSGGAGELEISSMGLYIEGDVNPYLGIRNNVSSNTTVGVTLSNVLSIQDNLIFSSTTNRLMVIPDQLSLFNTSISSNDAIFSLYLNPDVAGSPIFVSADSNSAVSYDTTGTTVTGGTLVGSFFLSSGSSLSINIGEYGLQLSPGDRLVIACAAMNLTTTVYASISWLEKF
jgi:hypothetical protein